MWVPFSLVIGIQYEALILVFGFAFLSALLSEAFVFYALSKGSLSISGTLFATYPLFTILFSYFLNSERLVLLQWIFVLFTLLGIVIVSSPKKFNVQDFGEKIYIIWPIFAAVAVGLSDSLSKGVIDRTSAQTFLFALAFAQIPVALAYLKITREPLSQFASILGEVGKYKFAILGSFLNVASVLFLWLAFANTLASIASPLTAAYPVLLLFLSVLFLRERPNWREWLGLIITIIGIIGISFYY